MIHPTLATLHLLAAVSSHSLTAVPMASPNSAVQNASFHGLLMYKTCQNHTGNTPVGWLDRSTSCSDSVSQWLICHLSHFSLVVLFFNVISSFIFINEILWSFSLLRLVLIKLLCHKQHPHCCRECHCHLHRHLFCSPISFIFLSSWCRHGSLLS